MNVNKAHMRLWVEDLRTTDAPQIREKLRGPLMADGDEARYGFCCLGRACEVAIAYGVDLRWSDDEWAYDTGGDDAESRFVPDVLPPVVRDWLGVREDNPIIRYGPDGSGVDLVRAATANDELELTFAQIADAIEDFYGLIEETQP